MQFPTIDTDVLVIGAGGAGLRAAIEASAQGVRVAVITKSLLGKAHTVMAEGGMAAAIGNVDDRDNWRVHFADTMRGGQYLNNWRLAHVGDRTGLEMIRTLQDHGVHQGLDVYMEHTVVSLLTDGGRAAGAVAYDRERGRFKVFRSKAVV